MNRLASYCVLCSLCRDKAVYRTGRLWLCRRHYNHYYKQWRYWSYGL